MTAIAFTARKLSTLVDGTVRLVIDIEPKDAIQAMQMFGMPGTTGAAARLTQEAATETLKGGSLSREAAGLCKREDFHWFVTTKDPTYSKGEGGAAAYIRNRCGVDSRAELDHNRGPAQEFGHIKREFLQYCHQSPNVPEER